LADRSTANLQSIRTDYRPVCRPAFGPSGPAVGQLAFRSSFSPAELALVFGRGLKKSANLPEARPGFF
jgi:hypothetical protein